MILGIKPNLLVLGLLLVCVREVIPLSIIRPRLSSINWDNSEGSGYGRQPTWDYESHSRSFDDYDDEGLTSGWESSGDDTSVVSNMDSLCVFSGLKSRYSGTKVHLSISFEELCGTSRDPETRKKCLKTICQCFSTDRDYSVHFKKHFSIECVATGNTGRRNNNNNNNNRPTAIGPRVHSTTWPANNPTRLSPINYDDDDDDDDEYTVEIDRSRVTELEKEKSSGHLNGIMSKTGLLASIMGGTIIGLLCAVLLAMFIVYRVKKRNTHHHQHGHPKSPPCPPLKGYTKNFEECDFYA